MRANITAIAVVAGTAIIAIALSGQAQTKPDATSRQEPVLSAPSPVAQAELGDVTLEIVDFDQTD